MLNYKLLSKMKCSVIGRVPKIHQVHSMLGGMHVNVSSLVVDIGIRLLVATTTEYLVPLCMVTSCLAINGHLLCHRQCKKNEGTGRKDKIST